MSANDGEPKSSDCGCKKGAGTSPVGHPCRRDFSDIRVRRFSQCHLDGILGSARAADTAREYPCCMSEDHRALRVGVLGAGQISQAAHFEACRKARNAELHAVCDVAEDLLERVAAIHAPKKAYGDYDAMISDPDVDAVIVAIADQFHVSMALRALEAGKHVLVEKPMGVTVEECEDLRDAARVSGLVVQVGTEKRFDEGIAFARDFIREQMGEMIALKAWYCDSTHRYTMTDALQPVTESSERRGNRRATARRISGATTCSDMR